MPRIEIIPGTRKIVWTQDEHGQWSSGDLEVRPVMHKHGPLCWKLYLDGECIGRSFGYNRPGLAKATAPLIKQVREILGGKTTEPSYQELRRAVIDLASLARRIARSDFATHRAELLGRCLRIAEKVGCKHLSTVGG
jgi:hypothetical protein